MRRANFLLPFLTIYLSVAVCGGGRVQIAAVANGGCRLRLSCLSSLQYRGTWGDPSFLSCRGGWISTTLSSSSPINAMLWSTELAAGCT